MQRDAKSVKSVNGPHDLKVQSADTDDFWIGAEQSQPHFRKQGRAPVQAILRARRYCLAPQLVPTMATSAVPKPNPSGMRMYSRRAPIAPSVDHRTCLAGNWDEVRPSNDDLRHQTRGLFAASHSWRRRPASCAGDRTPGRDARNWLAHDSPARLARF